MITSGLARIGNDPVLRHTQSGDAVLSLSLAVNYGRKDSEGNYPTQWYDAALWGKRAEALQPYLAKGNQISVVLQDLHIETFDRKDGGQGSKLVARVMEIELVKGQNAGDKADQPRQAQPRQQAPVQQAQSVDDGLDDDIPF
jgi:single-strand DNA-binding protein